MKSKYEKKRIIDWIWQKQIWHKTEKKIEDESTVEIDYECKYIIDNANVNDIN